MKERNDVSIPGFIFKFINICPVKGVFDET